MKLSTKARYATSALIEIALSQKGKPLSISEMSNRLGLSKNYLEQLFRRLKAARLVKSQKGLYGGYSLAQKPSQINLKAIFEAVGEETSPVFCLSQKDLCQQSKACLTRSCWAELEKKLNQFLEGKTLADLIS